MKIIFNRTKEITMLFLTCVSVLFALRMMDMMMKHVKMKNQHYHHQPHLSSSSATTTHNNHNINKKKKLWKEQEYDVVIVGAGLSGAVLAERHANDGGQRVLVLEKRDHIGGNCYDYIDSETGIRVSKYGAHLFHTNNEQVWQYVNRFSQWRRWDHRVLARVNLNNNNNMYVPVPVTIETVNQVFGLHLRTGDEMAAWLRHNESTVIENSKDMAISRVGERLYELIFGPYTEKQWNTSAENLDKEVTARIPVHLSFDDRYFEDKYQALPADGYTQLFENMLLDHPNITVVLETDYFDVQKDLIINVHPPLITTYFTGPIDRFFGTHERLEYRSLVFKQEVIYDHVGYAQAAAVVNYPSLDVPYTRVIEYKQMLWQTSPHTILVREYPSEVGEPYYPVPTEKNKRLYAKLQERSKSVPSVVFVGRLANYKYFNMDEAIAHALKAYDNSAAKKKIIDNVADIHVVTTVFMDDLGWVPRLCRLLGPSVAWTFYNKHPTNNINMEPLWNSGCHQSVVEIRMPNVGREGYAWLKHIQNNTKRFSKINVFVQGGLHQVSVEEVAQASLDALQMYNNDDNQNKAMVFKPFVGAMKKVLCGKKETGQYIYQREALVQLADKMQVDIDKICCHYGGQFVASNAVLERAWYKWKDVIEAVIIPGLETANDPPIGHALERLWMTMMLMH